jgi:hypothetical protein
MKKVLFVSSLALLFSTARAEAASVTGFYIDSPWSTNRVGIATSGTTYVTYHVTVTRSSTAEQVLLSLDLETKDQYGNFRYIGAPGSTLEIATDDFFSDQTEKTFYFTEDVTKSDVYTATGTLNILLRKIDYFANTNVHDISAFPTELVNPSPLAPNTIQNAPDGWLIGSTPGANDTTYNYWWEKKVTLLGWVPVFGNCITCKDLHPVGQSSYYRRKVTSSYSIIAGSVSNSLKPN